MPVLSRPVRLCRLAVLGFIWAAAFFAWFRDEGGVATFRDHLASDLVRYARFAALMLEEGVRLIPAGRWYLNAAHGEAEVDAALAAADRALPRLAR